MERRFIIFYSHGGEYKRVYDIVRASDYLNQGWTVKELIDVQTRDVPVTTTVKEII